jgi:LacI family transcriptional regulator
MRTRPTIKDVANKAGTSISTVSLVLNNSGYVSAKTRQTILRTVHELAYHPTRSARGLASKASGNLGFILTEDHFSQAEPFYTRIFLGAEFEARQHHYYLLLTTIGKRFDPNTYVPRFLLERNVDGIIVAGKISRKLIDYIESLGLPIVLVDFQLEKKQLPSVLIDNEGGARLATRHLVRGGHRAIAFVAGDIRHPSIAGRLSGFRHTMSESGLEVNEKFVVVDERDTRFADGYHGFDKILANGVPPTAVVAANDAMAFGCMQNARRRGIRIPDDVAIVGFDDVEMCSHVEPRLTTVSVAKEEMGKRAVQHMADVVRSKTRTIITAQVPVRLLVRESTGIPPAAEGEVQDTSSIPELAD